MAIDPNVHFDWQPLVGLATDKLLVELADAHGAIANLSLTVAFLRQEELRGTDGAKEQRLESEGLKDAFVEKKWLLRTLLDHQEPS